MAFFVWQRGYSPERRFRRGLRFRPPPAAEGGRNLRRSGRRLARRRKPPQTEPGTARGLAKQVQIPLSPPNKKAARKCGLFCLAKGLFTRAPVPARAEISTAAGGGGREKSQAQRSAIGKAAEAAADRAGHRKGACEASSNPSFSAKQKRPHERERLRKEVLSLWLL